VWGLGSFGGEVDASGFCCPFKTTQKNRPSAQFARWNTKIALYGKSHQSPLQRPNLSIRFYIKEK